MGREGGRDEGREEGVTSYKCQKKSGRMIRRRDMRRINKRSGTKYCLVKTAQCTSLFCDSPAVCC